MIRLSLVLLCLIISGCGTQSIKKPSLVLNAESYSQDAMQAYRDEKWVVAQRLFNRALSTFQSVDDRQAVLISHLNLVEVALAKHDKPMASQHLIQAELIVKREEKKQYIPRITLLNVLLAMQQKQLLKAGKLLQKLLPAFVENTVATAPNAIQLASISTRTKLALSQQTNEEMWVLRYENVLKKVSGSNDGLSARLFRFQAEILSNKGENKKAVTKLKQALVVYKQVLSRTGIANTLSEIGTLYQQMNDKAQALNYFTRAMTVFQSLADNEKIKEVTDKITHIEQHK